MELLEFSRTAWKSANSYYNYLKESKNRGKSTIYIISIHQIANKKFTLFLSKPISYLDSTEFKVDSEYCPFDIDDDDIRIVEYNDLSSYIVVVTSNRFAKILKTIPTEDIMLQSDLSFLVKAVRDWYATYYEKIAFPPAPQKIQVFSRPEQSSDEQYKAICSALTSPISYIWGAPGTGKTQMVLANCILSYAENNDQVLLMAPTNNALEQSLRGIISVLDHKKINRRKIIRLGKATSSFLTQYPELCEVGYYDSLVDSLKQELDNLKTSYSKQKTYYLFSSNYNAYKETIDKHNTALKSKDEYSKKIFDLNKRFSPIQNEISNLQKEKSKIENTLEKLQNQQQKQNFYLVLIENNKKYSEIIDKHISSLNNISKKLLKLNDELSNINEKIISIQNDYSQETAQLNTYFKKKNSLVFKIKSLFSKAQKENLNDLISKQQNKINNITALIRSEESRREQISNRITNTENSLTNERLIESGTPELLKISQTVFGECLSYNDLAEAFENILLEYKTFHIEKNIDIKINSTQKELNTVITSLESKTAELERIKSQINEVTILEGESSALLLNLRCKLSEIAIKTFGKDLSLENLFKEFEKQFKEYENLVEIPNIEELINDKEQTYQNIMVELKDILSERTIIACTVDYATIHYDKFAEGIANRAVHLFVDESAYCPLIKSGVFFSFGIPVTFLGDHMQLPPICEMDRQTILSNECNHNIMLWDISAIHFPDLFDGTITFDKLINDYVENTPPHFNNVSVSFLKKTFRFGENLAYVLDKFIYKQGFCGNVDSNTEIILINAPGNTLKTVRNESLAEALAIKTFLKYNHLTDFVILTPYKKQRALIESQLRLPAEKVLTIHSSQGREWETVIISVVDAKRKFFMSSKNKKANGLRIVNTAISRAKKKLVLVIDQEFWIDKEDELLSALIDIFRFAPK